MKAPDKDLPHSQMQIMEVLWQKGEATIREVHTEMAGKRKLAYQTVAVLLYRLRDRKYVESEERESVLVFRPLVDKDAIVNRKLDDLVSKVLGGSLAPLALYVARNPDLTPEQIAALEQIAESLKPKEEEDGK
jgi:BlaI family penicillinase repressor